MSISDSTSGANKRILVRLSDAQWAAARFDYESGNLRFKTEISAKYGISLSNVEKRSRKELWTRNSELGHDAQSKLREATSHALTVTAERIADRLGKRWEADMAPFFEREKQLHIRDSLTRAKARQKLADSIVNRSPDITAKDAALIAKCDDTYDVIKRRNLGMGDTNATTGALNLNILTNHSAVQIIPPGP